MSDFQQQCLEALIKFPNGHASADQIAARVGMARNGRLAVTSAFRSLLARDNKGNPDVSPWIVRLAPRDQWGHATWCITDKSYALLGYCLAHGRWVKKN